MHYYYTYSAFWKMFDLQRGDSTKLPEGSCGQVYAQVDKLACQTAFSRLSWLFCCPLQYWWSCTWRCSCDFRQVCLPIMTCYMQHSNTCIASFSDSDGATLPRFPSSPKEIRFVKRLHVEWYACHSKKWCVKVTPQALCHTAVWHVFNVCVCVCVCVQCSNTSGSSFVF